MNAPAPPFDVALVLDPHGPGTTRVHFPARPNARTLLAGRPAESAGALLPSLFALCGHAHRVAARLAVDAARDGAATATVTERQSLADEIVREHVRSVFLDWPQQVPVLDAAALAGRQAALLACPLFRPDVQRTAAVAWAEEHVFGASANRWPDLFASDAAFDAWCARGRTLPARWLGAVLHDARACAATASEALPATPSPAARTRIDAWLLADDPAGTGAPVFESGCWLRRGTARDAADRLVARLWEIAARLTGATPLPRADAWTLQPGRALTLVEIARGVLLHAARLDRTGSTLEDYRVQAPTDWNFAPNGPVASALDAVAGEAAPARREHLARIVATAFTPCLPFQVQAAAA